MPELTITLSDIIRLIELSKKRAELDFKAKVTTDSSGDAELRPVSAQIAVLTDKFLKAGMSVAMPREKQINDFNDELKKFKDKDILEALRSKHGGIYELLSARGILLKENYDNRANIAKINILLSRFPVTTRVKLLDALRNGKLSQDISVEGDEKSKLLLVKLFARLGIMVFMDGKLLSSMPSEKDVMEMKEIPVAIGNSCVWVSQGSADSLIELNNKIKQISTKIQLRNAERQVRVFNEKEEQEFAQLQTDYLSLLKDQDALLAEYYTEEKELVFRFFTT